MKALLPIIGVLALTPVAFAQEDASSPFGKWHCMKPSSDDLFKFEVSSPKVRVNNFAIQESNALVTDAPTLTFSAAVANRSEKNVAITVEIVGISGGSPVFALSGDAGFGFVPPGKNAEVKGTIATPRGSMKRAEQLCIRVGGYQQNR